MSVSKSQRLQAFSKSLISSAKKTKRTRRVMSKTVLASSSSSNANSSASSNSADEDENLFEHEQTTITTEPSKPKSSLKKSCPQCGKIKYRSSFYGTNKQFCCRTCQQLARNKAFKNKVTSFKMKPRKKLTLIKKPHIVKQIKTAVPGSFDWRTYLNRPGFISAPVQYFKHAQLSESWVGITPGLKVEVLNNDWYKYENRLPKYYWIASIIRRAGYMAKLRYEGCESENSNDFWVNLCMGDVHEIGWCKTYQFFLVPPKCIEKNQTDWKSYLQKSLLGTKTLPKDFTDMIVESLSGNIEEGMTLEAVDKAHISCVKVARVTKVVGGRLHLEYQSAEPDDDGFWCHERSPLIHPVGWAQVMNHNLISTPDYPRQSFEKVLYQGFESTDARWGLFMPVFNPEDELEFKVGSKLEAIDPLNPSAICVSTVMKTLRNGYLMIGIDGVMAEDGSDWFCYHTSSPYIFPMSFCETNNIKLTPPPEYKNCFNWKTYLKKEKAIAVPAESFIREDPNHEFVEGMHLEAVDIMDPHLICVAKITRVVGRLLRIHFDGWEEDYDQWCDYESPELYPIGWCDMVGYRLEPPPSKVSDEMKKKKKIIYKGGRRKKRVSILPKKSSPDQEPVSKKIRKISIGSKSGILKPSNSPEFNTGSPTKSSHSPNQRKSLKL